MNVKFLTVEFEIRKQSKIIIDKIGYITYFDFDKSLLLISKRFKDDTIKSALMSQIFACIYFNYRAETLEVDFLARFSQTFLHLLKSNPELINCNNDDFIMPEKILLVPYIIDVEIWESLPKPYNGCYGIFIQTELLIKIAATGRKSAQNMNTLIHELIHVCDKYTQGLFNECNIKISEEDTDRFTIQIMQFFKDNPEFCNWLISD